jgi:hypothetical protein
MDEMIRDKSSGVGVTDVPVRASGTGRQAVWGLAALLGAMFLGNVDVAIAARGLVSVRRG